MTLDYPLEDASLGLVDSVVVDGGVAPAHEAVSIELPQLIPMTSPPAPLRVVALVLEPDRDAVPREAPEVLLKTVVQFPCPLAPQEVPDRFAPFEELVAVAPLGVLRVGERHLLGIAGVPGVLGGLDLLLGRLLVERWYRRSDALVLSALLHSCLLLSAHMLAARDSYADTTAALGFLPGCGEASLRRGWLTPLIKPLPHRGSAWRGFRKAATVRSLRELPLQDCPQAEGGMVLQYRSYGCYQHEEDFARGLSRQASPGSCPGSAPKAHPCDATGG